MGAITRIALHGPRAVPVAVALRASDRRTVGLTLGMVWLLVGAAISVAAPGTPHPAALGQTRPVASTTASDPVVIDNSLAMPHAPMSARNWPGTSTTMLAMQPVPAFVGVDDPPGLGPAPAADPAVARLLAQLLDQAKGSPTDPRPGPQALVALDFALAQVGRPYVWGATGPDSYDCSGLTWRSYAQAGIALPRVSADQHALGGRPVAITDLLPGDLVFFATAAWDPGAVHHVGMYVGRGLMVDAPHPGTYVRVGAVRTALLSATPMLSDAVIAGENRECACALAWLNAAEAVKLLGAEPLAQGELIVHEIVHRTLAQALADHNAAAGSAARVERLVVMARPADMDGGEITDKGYVNQRQVLINRSTLVELLYAQPVPAHVIVAGRMV